MNKLCLPNSRYFISMYLAEKWDWVVPGNIYLVYYVLPILSCDRRDKPCSLLNISWFLTEIKTWCFKLHRNGNAHI